MERICGIDSTGEPWCIGEEIIRCRDCKHKFDYRNYEWCGHNHTEDGEALRVLPDWFCAWAE